MISQLTVFLENEKGRLAAACRAVSDAGINMHALNLADTADFGVARMLTDTPDAAAEALRAQGYRATVTPVLGVRVPNVPGGLASLLEFMDEQNANIEYGYCFSVNAETAVDVLKVEGTDDLEEKLTAAGFEPVRPEDIYRID
ncbi:amino acid-binding protein [Eggerthella sinensis]|uniref:Amino acid-binding protein n=1 Tax=Eggerthella sinensis TaxID=242230 RepID=A0A3N0ISZ7_9ACTN|nr:amino acid-binding protein [Eggerthella sinensis]MCB7036992.1 amino acid-binding protein [Eggerthella sinensis]RDB68952.1 amino acid-binding protein [Eggerthella sinensis]RNM40121.1 amino acid-binding protein [Eggerthella sinensis]